MVNFQVIFRWYDFWVGFYFDRTSNKLYIFPIPMLGVVIKFREPNLRESVK